MLQIAQVFEYQSQLGQMRRSCRIAIPSSTGPGNWCRPHGSREMPRASGWPNKLTKRSSR